MVDRIHHKMYRRLGVGGHGLKGGAVEADQLMRTRDDTCNDGEARVRRFDVSNHNCKR